MPDIDLVKEYWNNNVSNWKIADGLTVGDQKFFFEVERYRFEKLNYLNKLIKYDGYKSKEVLDVGCGLATDLSRFAAGGANATGVDVSPTAVDLAKRNFQQRELSANLEIMNGEQLTFESESFDYVYCHTVLHFTPNPERMVREIHRVLKPGGQALLMTINRKSWLYFLHRIAGLKIDYLDAPVFHRFDTTEFEEITKCFSKRKLVVERFPIRTEVHKGWKAFVYNVLFVDFYNLMPQWLIGKTGYHLLYFVEK